MKYIDINNKYKYSDIIVLNEISINNSIKNILNTQVGSFPGHPEFGSNLNQFIFSLINPMTEQLVKKEVIYSLSRWEPRIKVLIVNVFEDYDYNRLLIKIIYKYNKDVKNNEYEYIYKIER